MAEALSKRREPAPGSFDELRSLIVGPEQRELRTIQAHLLDPSKQVRDVSRVLPDALALRSGDPQLTRALAPSIEEALTASVQRDPRPLADALFPVMGPAIRKAITHTLASMMESLNRTVEHSVSVRGLQWRWTALRTGRPFAEIVLLNTLQYRVEQVFLIHRETGLPLLHLSADPRGLPDADQISAMLTAIQDFVHDSFRTPASDGVDALRVGELTVIVEQGPLAILAGVVRGAPPVGLRPAFQEALETVHLRFAAELEDYNGDSAPFDRARPVLETCLVSRYRGRTAAPSYRGWAIAAAVLALTAAAWMFAGYRERQRWNAYVDRLRAEPGIVVVSSGRSGGHGTISGLRDPLSTDPSTLTAGSGLSLSSIAFQWEPYQAIRPAFIEARARDLLRPPAGVSFKYDDGVLRADGTRLGALDRRDRAAGAGAGWRPAVRLCGCSARGATEGGSRGPEPALPSRAIDARARSGRERPAAVGGAHGAERTDEGPRAAGDVRDRRQHGRRRQRRGERAAEPPPRRRGSRGPVRGEARRDAHRAAWCRQHVAGRRRRNRR